MSHSGQGVSQKKFQRIEFEFISKHLPDGSTQGKLRSHRCDMKIKVDHFCLSRFV